MDSSPQASDLCLVLVGSIGCGKTLTTDTLLGQTSNLISSRECKIRQALSEGRRLSVVETPRWYWRGSQVEANIQMETQQAVDMSPSGPLVFLILIPIGEFTEIEQKIPDQLEKMFGQSVLHHTLVLLTCGDYLMSRSLHEYLSQEKGLQEVVRRCHGRCHVINNRKPHDRQQVIKVLEEVEQMIQKNGGFTLNRDVEILEKSQFMLNATGKELCNRFTHQTETDSKEEKGSEAIIETHLVNGIHTQRYEHKEAHVTHLPLERSSSFKLNREGAILSNMIEESETQHNQNFINTFHHSIRKVVDGSESLSAMSSSTSCDVQNGPSLPELRMILLGRRGSGKSHAGNVILGCQVFDPVPAVAQQCVKGQTLVQNQKVSVVDTPDWFDSERSPEEVKHQISRCLLLSAPGPHVFLMCVPVNRPAHSELPALRALEVVFGPDAVRRHTLVLFTHSDLLSKEVVGEEGLEGYIASRRPEMLELVQKCGDRYHVLRHGDRGGVTELLDKVQQTVRESGGGYYSCSTERESGSCVERRQEQISTVWRERSHPLHALKETEEDDELIVAAEKNVHLNSVAPNPSSTQTPSLLRSVCYKAGSVAKGVPKVLAVGALTGAALGVFLAGLLGGAVGALLGSVVSEVGRRRYNKQKTE